eukprot:10715884-Alexandrium_andersonii.AAC.1
MNEARASLLRGPCPNFAQRRRRLRPIGPSPAGRRARCERSRPGHDMAQSWPKVRDRRGHKGSVEREA